MVGCPYGALQCAHGRSLEAGLDLGGDSGCDFALMLETA